MIPTPFPFLPQETDYTCAVACLRMVLVSFGIIKTEAELRDLCDCTPFGTAAFELTRAAQSLGLANTRKLSLELTDLQDFIEQGRFPIIYTATYPNGFVPEVHALIVLAVSEAEVTVIDPKLGQLDLSPATIMEMWKPMRNVAVIVAE